MPQSAGASTLPSQATWYRVLAVVVAMLVIAPTLPVSAAEMPNDVAANTEFFTDFSGDTPGERPADWTQRWRGSDWTVAGDPPRLVHNTAGSSRRTGLTWDDVGHVEGDAEIYLRWRGTSSSVPFTILLYASGEPGSESAYYLDTRLGNGDVRINVYRDGAFSSLGSAPFVYEGGDRWVDVVVRRSGDQLTAKMWHDGDPEPEDWQITVTDSRLDGGAIGIGGFSANSTAEFAAFGVGLDGVTAPRVPLDPPHSVTPPAGPQNLAASGGQDNIAVTWDPVVDAVRYEVEREDVVDIETTDASYTEEGVGPETTRSYRVRAITSAGATAWSGPVVATTDPPTPPATFEIDFADEPAWRQPANWTSMWSPSNFYVKHDPDRLVHYAHADNGGRKLLSSDEVGVLGGDVEVAALVRVTAPLPPTRYQVHLHASGTRGAENSYYMDVRPNDVRIARFVNGGFSILGTAPHGGFDADRWYHTVLSRTDDDIRVKVWPLGEAEPADWLLEVTDDNHASGRVGFGGPAATTSNDTQEYAWLGVGAAGEPAPRTPETAVPLPAVPTAVTGLQAEVTVGGVNLRWDPDPAASWFEVQRDDEIITGRWRQPSFHDPLTRDGASGTYRVRAVDVVEGAGPWSDPATVTATDLPDQLILDFETQPDAPWTTYDEELAFTAALAEATDRVSVEEIGRSGEDRSIEAVRIGHPEAPTDVDIAERPAVVFNCNQHGDEPAGRQACLISLRELALSEDPRVQSFLSDWASCSYPRSTPMAVRTTGGPTLLASTPTVTMLHSRPQRSRPSWRSYATPSRS